MAHLVCVQGDTLKTDFNFNNVDGFSTIAKACFTCKALGVNAELTSQQDGTWRLLLPTATTKDFKIGEFKFDITIKNSTDEIKTVLYNNTLIVKQKVNTVT